MAQYGYIDSSGTVVFTPRSLGNTSSSSSSSSSSSAPVQSTSSFTSTQPVFGQTSIPQSAWGSSSAQYGQVDSSGNQQVAPVQASYNQPVFGQQPGMSQYNPPSNSSNSNQNMTPISYTSTQSLQSSEPVFGQQPVTNISRQEVFGDAPKEYWGTSSIEYGEVSQQGYNKNNWYKEYTKDKITRDMNDEFVSTINPKIVEYNSALAPVIEKSKSYENKIKQYESEVDLYNEKYAQTDTNGVIGSWLNQKAFELETERMGILDEYNTIEANKNFTMEDAERVALISSAFSIYNEKTKPLRDAQEVVNEKFKDVEPYFKTNEDGTFKLNKEGSPELDWQTKALIGDIPVVGGVTGFFTRPFTKRDDKINEFNKAQDEVTRLDAIYNPTNFDFSGLTTSTLEGMKNNIMNNKDYFMNTKINKDNYNEFKIASGVLGSYDSIKSRQPTKLTTYDNTDLKAITNKVEGYEIKQDLKKYSIYAGTVIAAVTPLPGDEIILAALGSGKLARIGLGAIKLAKSQAIYSASSPVIDVGLQGYANVKTSIQNKDVSYLFKTMDSSNIKAYQTALDTEQSSLNPVGRFINENAPFFTDSKTRAGLGVTLYLASKGKLGKGVGASLFLSGFVPQIDKFTSNVDAYQASLRSQKISTADINYLTNVRNAKMVGTGIKLAMISTQSEIYGEGVYGRAIDANPIIGATTKGTKGISKLYGIFPTTEAFRKAYISSRGALFTAGVYEGANTAYINAGREMRKPSAKEVFSYGLLGGVSARVIGGAVIGFSGLRPVITKASARETLTMGSVYSTDLNEYLGDALAGRILNYQNQYMGKDLTSAYLRKGAAENTIDIYGMTEKGQRNIMRVPIFTNIDIMQQQLNEAYSNIAIDGKTSIYQPTSSEVYVDMLESPVNSNIYQSIYASTNIPTDTFTSSNIKSNLPTTTTTSTAVSTNVNIPINTNINVPTNTNTNLPINTNINMPIEIESNMPITTNVNNFLALPISTNVNLPENVNVPNPISISVNEPVSVQAPIPINITVPKYPGILPWTGYGNNYGRGKKKGDKKKTGYNASFDAIVLGIFGKNPGKSVYSGQETRPIIGTKKSRVKTPIETEQFSFGKSIKF